MTRLRNTRSGVVVSVDDATAARLGPVYVPVDAERPAEAPKPARRRSAKKKSS